MTENGLQFRLQKEEKSALGWGEIKDSDCGALAQNFSLIDNSCFSNTRAQY